jgi:uncharacterized membrane protein
MSVDEAVAALGDVEQIASLIISETPLVPKVIAKTKTNNGALNVILLVVLSPIWVPLAIGLAITALSVYLTLWIVIAVLWLTVAILIVSGLLGIVACAFFLFTDSPLSALFIAGSGLVCAGIGIFCFFGVLVASKGLFRLTQLFANKIKSLFVRREAHHE